MISLWIKIDCSINYSMPSTFLANLHWIINQPWEINKAIFRYLTTHKIFIHLPFIKELWMYFCNNSTSNIIKKREILEIFQIIRKWNNKKYNFQYNQKHEIFRTKSTERNARPLFWKVKNTAEANYKKNINQKVNHAHELEAFIVLSCHSP